ncbi:uncharacterized protein isoform X2 [Castor canadensis]|uniref:Uncharacterized protein isoform X2 n=5 Tax=Castor canadensis TaxID=51338 RepID=A0AC58ML52_CASCN
MLVARIRLEVRLAAGIWCQAVPWLCAAGVRREVCRDASEGDLVGGASGCAQLEFGGRCFRMRAAGVRRDACGMVQAGGAAGCGGQAGENLQIIFCGMNSSEDLRSQLGHLKPELSFLTMLTTFNVRSSSRKTRTTKL